MSTAKLEHKGYNRGLILGLTMAESLLLLVFCLLLIAAAIISAERDKFVEAERQREALANVVERLNRENDALKQQYAALEQQLAVMVPPAERDRMEEQLRELVLAQEAYSAMQAADVEIDELAELVLARDVLTQRGFDVSSPEALNAGLEERLRSPDDEDNAPHEWPPIISLSDADDFRFEIGSAELTPTFETSLRSGVTEIIAQNLELYGVDIVEVIGHTDEQPIAREETTFDQTVLEVVNGNLPISAIIPADNAGLGLARAIAVANVLRSQEELSGVTVLPLSAGQLVIPGDRVTEGQVGDVRERRRIEIRIRRREAPSAPTE